MFALSENNSQSVSSVQGNAPASFSWCWDPISKMRCGSAMDGSARQIDSAQGYAAVVAACAFANSGVLSEAFCVPIMT